MEKTGAPGAGAAGADGVVSELKICVKLPGDEGAAGGAVVAGAGSEKPNGLGGGAGGGSGFLSIET